MHYTEVLDKENRVAGVHVADLPEEMQQENITMFYDPEADYVVINLDRDHSDRLTVLASIYLQAAAAHREAFRKQTKAFAEECRVLDTCLLYREIAEMLRISGEMITGGLDLNGKVKLYTDIRKLHNDDFLRMDTAYNCGYIQGVRHERAR